VTGAASGIGLAISQSLSQFGCEVVLADIQADRVEKAAKGIRSRGGKADWAKLDVRSLPDMDKLVRETASRAGRLDYMFNNAGIPIAGPTHELTADGWEQAIDVNFRGVCYGSHAAYSIMHQQGFGHIINMASLAGLISTSELVAYTATKHGVVGLSNSLRAEARHYGVKVSVVCPGAIDTEILTGGKYGILHGVSGKELRGMFTPDPMDVSTFAKNLLRDVSKNKGVIIYPRSTKYTWWWMRLIPTWLQLTLTGKRHFISD
jgi:NAD(P)-dependent dehydrogenase (short-subunit alcohol dehydrogenase family)